jgi:Glycosyl transferase family 11
MSNPSIIIAYKPGQLGNRIQLQANLMAWVLEHGGKLYNWGFDDYAKLFPKIFHDPLFCYPAPSNLVAITKQRRKFLVHFLRISSRLLSWFSQLVFLITSRKIYRVANLTVINLDWYEPYFLDSQFLELTRSSRSIIFVRGLEVICDPAYKLKYRHQICDLFTPEAQTKEQVDELLSCLRRGTDVLIGIHVRLGDFKDFADGNLIFSLCEYCAFMQEIRAFFPNRLVRFVITSDETLSRKDFDAMDLEIEFSGGGLLVDLLILAGCDFIVGPASSYSSWASFYGNTPLLHLYRNKRLIRLETFQVSDLHTLYGSKQERTKKETIRLFLLYLLSPFQNYINLASMIKRLKKFAGFLT